MVAIEGLHVLRGFLGAAESRAAFSAAVGLSEQAHLEAARIPSPGTASVAHNINSRERFKSMSLALEDGRTAVCEHFSDYGDGHRLTYYRRELPALGGLDLVERLAALPAVKDELASSRSRLRRPEGPEKWRLTLNHYPPAAAKAAAARVGFPWHRDLAANGAATMILNLGASGALEFGEEPSSGDGPVDGMRYGYSDHGVVAGDSVRAIERVTLTDGDLLLLTGSARWEYLHRVTPSTRGQERVSLVYGVW